MGGGLRIGVVASATGLPLWNPYFPLTGFLGASAPNGKGELQHRATVESLCKLEDSANGSALTS